MTDTDPSVLLQSALIEANEQQRTAASLTLLALEDTADSLLDVIEALPAEDRIGVLAAMAQLSGMYLALAVGRDKRRAVAALRQIFPDLDGPSTG
jgi:hypothetical protein